MGTLVRNGLKDSFLVLEESCSNNVRLTLNQQVLIPILGNIIIIPPITSNGSLSQKSSTPHRILYIAKTIRADIILQTGKLVHKSKYSRVVTVSISNEKEDSVLDIVDYCKNDAKST